MVRTISFTLPLTQLIPSWLVCCVLRADAETKGGSSSGSARTGSASTSRRVARPILHTAFSPSLDYRDEREPQRRAWAVALLSLFAENGAKPLRLTFAGGELASGADAAAKQEPLEEQAKGGENELSRLETLISDRRREEDEKAGEFNSISSRGIRICCSLVACCVRLRMSRGCACRGCCEGAGRARCEAGGGAESARGRWSVLLLPLAAVSWADSV